MIENYCGVVSMLAGRVLYKMLQNGEEGIDRVENAWINEYADILYKLYPDRRDNLQNLVHALNQMKSDGVRVRMNGFSPNDTTDDTFIVEQL